LSSWTVYDEENILGGPEIKVATKVCEDGTQVQAMAYHDIFNKKKAQKILNFFAADFAGIENALCHWAIIGKTNKGHSFTTIFIPYDGKDKHLKEVKKYAEFSFQDVNVLTQAQRTADWFTLRAFHLSATMISILYITRIINTVI
jgi:hypothetical protein